MPGQEKPDLDIEHAKALFLRNHPQLKERRYFLYLGRLVKVKGCDTLIDAFAKVKDVDPKMHLVFAGPDQDGWQEELQRMANHRQLSERVHFTGMLDYTNRWGAIANAECMVLSSHHENFSYSTVEGLACGKPSLLSSQVGIWQNVVDCGAGLAAEDNSDDFARILKQWMLFDSIEKSIMSQRARQCFIENFELKQSIQYLLSVLDTHSQPAEQMHVVNY
jgi:glycosyltransferase involved in cell wall biosynthesis